MSLTKRMRFEILRRDGHKCFYCGACAPDVKLTVDHVVPVALGGTDEPTNLVAACADCNAGKSSTKPDSPVVSSVSDRALILARAMELVQRGRAINNDDRLDSREYFENEWVQFTDRNGEMFDLDIDWAQTIDRFQDMGLEMFELDDARQIAMGSRAVDKWRYFCGVCWSRIREMQGDAITLTEYWDANGLPPEMKR